MVGGDALPYVLLYHVIVLKRAGKQEAGKIIKQMETRHQTKAMAENTNKQERSDERTEPSERKWVQGVGPKSDKA